MNLSHIWSPSLIRNCRPPDLFPAKIAFFPRRQHLSYRNFKNKFSKQIRRFRMKSSLTAFDSPAIDSRSWWRRRKHQQAQCLRGRAALYPLHRVQGRNITKEVRPLIPTLGLTPQCHPIQGLTPQCHLLPNLDPLPRCLPDRLISLLSLRFVLPDNGMCVNNFLLNKRDLRGNSDQ